MFGLSVYALDTSKIASVSGGVGPEGPAVEAGGGRGQGAGPGKHQFDREKPLLLYFNDGDGCDARSDSRSCDSRSEGALEEFSLEATAEESVEPDTPNRRLRGQGQGFPLGINRAIEYWSYYGSMKNTVYCI